MNLSVGIIGLPNVGKSTLFKALTKQKVDISSYPFCTIEPNTGLVQVPDERLQKIAEIIQPQKITPAVIEFVDIAGLVRQAHQGKGLGNQFLARIREVAAILQVVRIFKDEKVSHLEGQPDPQRDIEIVNTELVMKDLETVSQRLEKIKKQSKSGSRKDKKIVEELIALEKIKKVLGEGKLISEEEPTINHEQFIKEWGLLTAKPMIYVFNISKQPTMNNEQLIKNIKLFSILSSLFIDLQLESEISELTEQEQKELDLPPSKLNQLIKACYQVLDLITFYTVAGGQETRAWALKNGSTAPQAGGLVHSDFQEKFIRAEVIDWQRLVEAGSWTGVRDKGWLKTVGRDYIVEDGDVIEFKI